MSERKWMGSTTLVASLVGMAGLLVGGAPATAADVRIAPLESAVAIVDVRSSDAEVVGKIVNETSDQLENVRIIVADQFLWKNERHPGENSPSSAYSLTVDGPIPPHGSALFRFERPLPLPRRTDGTFETEVSAVEVVRRPVIASSLR